MSRHATSNVMNREVRSRDFPQGVLTLPYLAIRGHLCFRCLLPSENMTKCGGCKRAVYCGKDCQRQDWGLQHKKDCKVLKSINEFEVNDTATSRTRDEWTSNLVSLEDLKLFDAR
jgi:splicing suppressor protein 51